MTFNSGTLESLLSASSQAEEAIRNYRGSEQASRLAEFEHQLIGSRQGGLVGLAVNYLMQFKHTLLGSQSDLPLGYRLDIDISRYQSMGKELGAIAKSARECQKLLNTSNGQMLKDLQALAGEFDSLEKNAAKLAEEAAKLQADYDAATTPTQRLAARSVLLEKQDQHRQEESRLSYCGMQASFYKGWLDADLMFYETLSYDIDRAQQVLGLAEMRVQLLSQARRSTEINIRISGKTGAMQSAQRRLDAGASQLIEMAPRIGEAGLGGQNDYGRDLSENLAAIRAQAAYQNKQGYDAGKRAFSML